MSRTVKRTSNQPANRLQFRRCLQGCLLSLALLLNATANAAASDALPWSQLVYEASKMWATARSELSLEQLNRSSPEELWQLTVNSTVVGNTEHVVEQFLPGTGQLVQRSRLSSGKNRRLKEYHYSPDKIVRIRRDPAKGEAKLPPEQWSKQRRRQLPMPTLETGLHLTSTYGLLVLASHPSLNKTGDELNVYVHTDLNLYRATLRVRSTATRKLDVDLQSPSSGIGEMAEENVVREIAVTAVAVGELLDKPDFELLGLSGNITILVDAEYRLPVEVRGRAPRLGQTQLQLRSAVLPGIDA
jgi:hypothetical protein